MGNAAAAKRALTRLQAERDPQRAIEQIPRSNSNRTGIRGMMHAYGYVFVCCWSDATIYVVLARGAISSSCRGGWQGSWNVVRFG